MKPITYWVQNDAINALVEEFGPTLEKLAPERRRGLISYLAEPEEWEWSEEMVHPLETVYPLVENLTRQEKDRLIEAIAATLTHNGTKTGTPN